jgi:hypothetical protein
MKKDSDIAIEIAKTLDSLDDLSTIKAKPYFYTRLSAKIPTHETPTSGLWNWSLAVMAIVVLVNIISMLSLWPIEGDPDEAIDLMATEYSLTQTDIYNTSLE